MLRVFALVYLSNDVVYHFTILLAIKFTPLYHTIHLNRVACRFANHQYIDFHLRTVLFLCHAFCRLQINLHTLIGQAMSLPLFLACCCLRTPLRIACLYQQNNTFQFHETFRLKSLPRKSLRQIQSDLGLISFRLRINLCILFWRSSSTQHLLRAINRLSIGLHTYFHLYQRKYHSRLLFRFPIDLNKCRHCDESFFLIRCIIYL